MQLNIQITLDNGEVIEQPAQSILNLDCYEDVMALLHGERKLGDVKRILVTVEKEPKEQNIVP